MKVSVIIPAYNTEKYLEQAVESVFSTEYPNLEILIIEDKSTDRTFQVAKSIEEKHPNSVLLFQTPGKKNCGAGAARNVGIKNATGDLIAFLDADDWYLPNRFTKCIPLLTKDKTIDGVYERTGVIKPGKHEYEFHDGILERAPFLALSSPTGETRKVYQAAAPIYTSLQDILAAESDFQHYPFQKGSNYLEVFPREGSFFYGRDKAGMPFLVYDVSFHQKPLPLWNLHFAIRQHLHYQDGRWQLDNHLLEGDMNCLVATLAGDTNGDCIVNSFDRGQVKAASGTTCDPRVDVNADGIVSSFDRGLVKSTSGNSVTCP